MQRTVLICRHAETLDPYPLQPDFDRELTPAGQKQAREAGTWLREKVNKVDAILASPAKRASATARIIASRLYLDETSITFEPELYNAREHQLLNCLSKLPDEVQTVVLVAHNPGITRLARELTGKLIGYLEPANILNINLTLQRWEEIH